MKKIQSLLFLISLCLWLQACKKSKSDAPPPTPLAAYPFDNDYITNSVSSFLHCDYTGNIASTSDSFDIQAALYMAGRAGIDANGLIAHFSGIPASLH